MQKQSASPISMVGLFIWGLAALFFLYEFFLRTFVGSVAHQVIPDLQLTAESFAIIGSAYYVAYAVMQIPVGILADKFGVKKIMVFAILVCVSATYAFAHSVGFWMAFISRFLMGFGSSFAFICLLIIAVTWFPRKYFGFFSGASQFIGTMGPLLSGGPLIAMMVRLHETWRVALTNIAAVGLVLALLVFLFVKTKPRGADQVMVFLQRDIPLKLRLQKLLRNKQAWAVALYSAMVYASIALLGAIWGTQYFQAKGYSQAVAASMVSLAWLGYAICCPLIGALSDIAKRRKPALLFCAVVGLVVTALIVYAPIHQAWIYSLLMFSLGMAAAGQNVGFAAIAEHVDLDTRATALGLNNGAMTLFAAILPPAVSYFIDKAASGHIQNLQASDFSWAFIIMPLAYLCAILIASFFIKETFAKPQKEAVRLRVD